MRLFGLACAALVAAFSVAPASACIVAPRWEMLFWAEAPEQVKPDEVVLEIQYLGVWEDPPGLSGDRDVVVITDCGPSRYHRYGVVRVLQGALSTSEIILAFSLGETEREAQRYTVVGRLASAQAASPPYFVARVPPHDQQLYGPEYWSVKRQVGLLPKIEGLN
jgi:hypothetical protein